MTPESERFFGSSRCKGPKRGQVWFCCGDPTKTTTITTEATTTTTEESSTQPEISVEATNENLEKVTEAPTTLKPNPRVTTQPITITTFVIQRSTPPPPTIPPTAASTTINPELIDKLPEFCGNRTDRQPGSEITRSEEFPWNVVLKYSKGLALLIIID